MANKFQATYNQIESVIGQLVSDNPGLRSGELEKIYLAQYPEQNTLGMKIRKGVEVKTILEDKVNDVLIAFKKSGQLLNKGSRYYPLGTDLSQVTPPKKAKKTKPVVEEVVSEPVVSDPVVEEVQVIEESPVVEETPVIEVEPVIEEVQVVEETPVVEEPVVEEPVVEEPVVEEKGVQVISSTLISVDEVEVEDNVAVKETTSTLTVEETMSEFGLDTTDDRISYNIKALRRGNKFDPFHTSKDFKEHGKVSKRYEVYRDEENNNIVLTQEGREDYVVVPMDIVVDHSNEAYSRFANKAFNEFQNADNHKLGSATLVQALITCTVLCSHTDDFGGLAEECTNPNCPVHVIWSKGAYYVDPTQ